MAARAWAPLKLRLSVSTCSSSLPASLGLLAHLKVLLLEGNPLRGIRRDLLSVGDLKKRSVAVGAPPPALPCTRRLFLAAC